MDIGGIIKTILIWAALIWLGIWALYHQDQVAQLFHHIGAFFNTAKH
jgi:hypothetical protein